MVPRVCYEQYNMVLRVCYEQYNMALRVCYEQYNMVLCVCYEQYNMVLRVCYEQHNMVLCVCYEHHNNYCHLRTAVLNSQTSYCSVWFYSTYNIVTPAKYEDSCLFFPKLPMSYYKYRVHIVWRTTYVYRRTTV